MGHVCGRHRVTRLMREGGLYVRSRKRWRLVSGSRHDLPIAPNHLDCQFVSDRANRHWVSDITNTRTAQGRLYLAVVLDLYSRNSGLGDAPPYAAGLGTRRAGDGRCPPTVTSGGTAAPGSRQPILRVRLPSVGSAASHRAQPLAAGKLLGQCSDGEFFRALKAERVYRTRYANYQEAKTDMFDYIRFYNYRRSHSTLGYLSPMEFEQRNASSSS